MVDFEGSNSGYIYYAKRVGWRWQVWLSYRDGSADPHSSATEWQADTVKFWRRINAERVANSLLSAFNSGVWVADGRRALIPTSEAE